MLETPLRWPESAKRLVTDDLDEVREFVDGIDGPHRRFAHGVGPLKYSGAVALGQEVCVASVETGLGQTVHGGLRAPTLHVVLAGSRRYQLGRAVIEPRADEILLLPPVQEAAVSAAPGAANLAVQIDFGLLGREVAAQCGRPTHEPLLQPRTFRVGAPSFGLLRALLEDWAAVPRTHELAGVASTGLRAAEARIAEWVAGFSARDEAGDARAGRALERIRAAEEWVEAHLGEPITLGRLCELAGVGKRCLQRVFYERRGVSPLEHVQRRRLAAARRQLLGAGPGGTVTTIATNCGFTHMGRFSVAYARAFGESPSATLRRR